MNTITLYQIIGAGLFIFGCYGLLCNKNRWSAIIFLQLMAGGVIVNFLAVARYCRAGQPAEMLTAVFIIGILFAMIVFTIIFTLKVFLHESESNSDTEP